MKIIPYFYYALAIVTFGVYFKLMADSTNALYFASIGTVGTVIFASVGALAKIIIDTAQIAKSTERKTEDHRKALKYLTKRAK